jgi:hypothetical protein
MWLEYVLIRPEWETFAHNDLSFVLVVCEGATKNERGEFPSLSIFGMIVGVLLHLRTNWKNSVEV